jgi:probable rRNA maturation factor
MIYKSYNSLYDINKKRFTYITSNVFQYLNLDKKQFSLFIVGKYKIKSLNCYYNNINSVTDVLALEYKDPFYIGDIYICPDIIYKNSKKFNCSFFEELDRIFIHGLLHILGYDHINPLNTSEKMFIIQEDILKKLKWNI